MRSNRPFYLVAENPFNLPAPPTWWRRLVLDYDKMLRVMPSQTERCYRLCRIVRREARLGLSAMVVHDHPDTRAAIAFGVAPVLSLVPDAFQSAAIIETLRRRDLWHLANGDPSRLVDQVEATETAAAEARTREAEAALDERSTSAYRAVKYGRPGFVYVRQSPHPTPRSPFTATDARRGFAPPAPTPTSAPTS